MNKIQYRCGICGAYKKKYLPLNIIDLPIKSPSPKAGWKRRGWKCLFAITVICDGCLVCRELGYHNYRKINYVIVGGLLNKLISRRTSPITSTTKNILLRKKPNDKEINLYYEVIIVLPDKTNGHR